MKRRVGLSKLKSLFLRHEPGSSAGRSMPRVSRRWRTCSTSYRREKPDVVEVDVRAMVEAVEPRKRGCSIVDDGFAPSTVIPSRSRSAIPAARLPDILFHGSAEGVLAGILANDLH